MNSTLKSIQNQIDNYKSDTNESVGELSDGYHSFDDLYRHRTLLLALVSLSIPYAWKSTKHEDGTMYEGMFVTGFPTPNGMISYHCDNEYWSLFKIPTLPHAPKFNGYTPNDVTNRIEEMIKNSSTMLVNRKDFETIEKIVEDEILPTFGEDLISKASYIAFYNR